MALSDIKLTEPVVLVLAGLATGVLFHTSSGRADSKQAAGRDLAAQHERTGTRTVEPPPTPDASAPPRPAVVAALRAAGYPQRRDRVAWASTVVALVPDPATSGFAAEFDQAMDAIQRAAQSQSYTVERYWLPWPRAGETVRQRDDAQQAGWILLRQDLPDATARYLAVMIVGERLGAGVNRAMLRDALDSQYALAPNARWLILGPYFSGTSASLRDGLEAWCAEPKDRCAGRDAMVVTGTATRPLNADILEQTKPLKVSFRATVNPDDALSGAMHHFLQHALRIDPERIGELDETSTAFGVAHATRANPEARQADRAAGAPGALPFRIALPPHLPDLRTGGTDATSGAMAFRDPDQSVDKLPLETPAGLREGRQMLNTTASALRRQGITDVGILTTASTDKISLVTALRAAARDIRPHVYEANQVLADPEQHAAMDGTLTASSYPVSPATQIWSAQRQIQPFASDAAEGVYNALLALLWRGYVIRDDDLVASLRDYRLPFDPHAPVGPPVWISVVVGGNVWPLATYAFESQGSNAHLFGRLELPGCTRSCAHTDDSEQALALAFAQADPPASHLDRGRMATVVLELLLAVVIANLLSLVRRLAPMRRCPFVLLYDPELAAAKESGFLWRTPLRDSDRRPAIMLGFWVLAVIGIGAGILYLFPILLTQSAIAGTDLLAGLLLLGSLTLLVAPLAGHPPPPTAEQAPTRWKRVIHPGHWIRVAVHVALSIAFVVGVAFTIPLFTSPDARRDGRAFFFFARLMNPGLGLTPAIPALTMAAGLYLCSLFRLRVVRRSRRILAAAVLWRANDFPDVADRLQAFGACSARTLARMLWMGAGLGLALFAWDRGRPRSLDGRVFDFTVAVAFGLMFAIALASLLRADRLWRAMAAHLRALAVEPWARAFATLPAHIAAIFRTPMPGRLRAEEVEQACRAARAVIDPARVQLATDPGEIKRLASELRPTWTAPGALLPALSRTPEAAPPPDVQVREHVLALHMVEVLSQMCDATRTTLFIGSVAGVAAVLATALYPFQPVGVLVWGTRIAIFAGVVVAMRVIGGIERDEILSRISGTTPGAVTFSWSLFMRVVGYVIVPLGALAAAHLPDHGLLSGLLAALNGKLSGS